MLRLLELRQISITLMIRDSMAFGRGPPIGGNLGSAADSVDHCQADDAWAQSTGEAVSGNQRIDSLTKPSNPLAALRPGSARTTSAYRNARLQEFTSLSTYHAVRVLSGLPSLVPVSADWESGRSAPLVFSGLPSLVPAGSGLEPWGSLPLVLSGLPSLKPPLDAGF